MTTRPERMNQCTRLVDPMDKADQQNKEKQRISKGTGGEASFSRMVEIQL